MLRRIIPLAAALGALAAPTAAQADAFGGDPGTREVVLVGNNWDGTASVLNPKQGYEEVARVNIVPDFEERMAEVSPLDPERFLFFYLIRTAIGEGHDQLVDDMYTTPNGRLLIVSRPSFKDVVGIRIANCEDLQDCKIAWRFEVAGQRSDHMGISPNGKEVAVSASTGNVVHILDTKTGQEVDQFASGDSPHENTYSADGERLYHASIGRVYVPVQDGTDFATDTLKGKRVFQVVDTDDYEVTQNIDLGKELVEAGHDDLSKAVRPMAIARNERKVYFQVSFFHGFLVWDFKKDRITKRVDLPNLVPDMPKEQYLLNSAHHGIALNGRGNRLCIAGTMSDYAAFIDVKGKRKFKKPKLRMKGEKPYWSTTSADGKRCYVSWSGTDSISVFSYAKRKEIANIPVGDHPQRVRTGYLPNGWIASHD
jgi:YVTN family beta-propeller protein